MSFKIVWFIDSFVDRSMISVVGATAATPSAAKWIFAIICYVGAALQLMGFVAVIKVCTFGSCQCGCVLTSS